MRIGVIFYGAKGWLWIDETGRNWQSYQGPVGEKNEKGPGSGDRWRSRPDHERGNHMQNFVDAIRANDPKLLTCDILEGHLSAALPHLANISYRVGHQLRFDPKTERFEDDKKRTRSSIAMVDIGKGSRFRSRSRS